LCIWFPPACTHSQAMEMVPASFSPCPSSGYRRWHRPMSPWPRAMCSCLPMTQPPLPPAGITSLMRCSPRAFQRRHTGGTYVVCEADVPVGPCTARATCVVTCACGGALRLGVGRAGPHGAQGAWPSCTGVGPSHPAAVHRPSRGGHSAVLPPSPSPIFSGATGTKEERSHVDRLPRAQAMVVFPCPLCVLRTRMRLLCLWPTGNGRP
jgi:hypothetical protein